jgi:hypothetical protein
MVKKYNSRKRRVYKKTRKINNRCRKHRGGIKGTQRFSKDKNTLFKNIVTRKHKEEVEEIKEKIKEKNQQIERLKKEKKHLEKENKMFSLPPLSSASASASSASLKSKSKKDKPQPFLEVFAEEDEEEE